MAYAGRLAVIAGGLGGLGTAIGQALRSRGASLALLYHPSEGPRRDTTLATAYGSSSPSDITAFECDITSQTSISSAFSSLPSAPSILINTAGYVVVSPLSSTTLRSATTTFNVNLLGPLLVSQAFHAARNTAQPGRIVSIASQAAHVALAGHGAYCASKAGLLGLTKCMAAEWGPEGVTSNTVSPTVVLTELGRKAWEDDVVRQKHLDQIPTGRFCEPDEVADAVEWLCRDGSGMVNGADIRLDGGFTIAR